MTVSGISGGASSVSNALSKDPLANMDMGSFLKLLITELQNQDPMEPMDNAQILQQISQIREIGATAQMQSTLEAVHLGQSVSSGSSMLGRMIRGLDDDGNETIGMVEQVTVGGNQVKLHVGEAKIDLKNVRDIFPFGYA